MLFQHHRGRRHSFGCVRGSAADRVVLAALRVRLDVLGWHQRYLMPQAPQNRCPVMRGATRLDADSRRRQLGKEFRHLVAPQLPPQYSLLVLVNPMNLKDMFGRVQTNSDNCSDGSPWLRFTTSQPGTFDAVGGRRPQHEHRPLPLYCGPVFIDSGLTGCARVPE